MEKGFSDVPKSQWPLNRLLAAALDGDSSAYTMFTAKVVPQLTGALKKWCDEYDIPKTEAADFAREVLVRAMDLVRADPSRSLQIGWFLRVGHNLAVSWTRQKRVKVERNIDAATDVGDKRCRAESDIELKDEVQKYFSWLDADDSDILSRSFINGESIDEIASDLDISKEAAAKRLQRALRTLCDLIEEYGKVKLPRMMRRREK